jgi:50S ribosomal protein L16 3-hydroxylase
MDIARPLALLGGLSPRQFMKRHWQKKPLVVRQAIPGFSALLGRPELFDLAAREEVESRLVAQGAKGWQMRRGPLPRRALPPVSRPGWTLLVQGVDLHDARVHDLLAQFRFVPEARLDDLMISWASDTGGVGPHFDSYDVFLLQAHGRRRWRIGRGRDLTLRDDVPLKILANFEAEEEHVLEPGDMLYLPPRWAHDGIAEGECQTYSIGFRSPQRGELARELLQRIADDAADAVGEALYADPGQGAVDAPGEIPSKLHDFARKALQGALREPLVLERALGEYLSEPKANVWFEAGEAPERLGGVRLDARSRMLYDAKHIFLNGESWRAGGRDAKLMRRLADERRLGPADTARASADAKDLLARWCEAGWLHETGEADER